MDAAATTETEWRQMCRQASARELAYERAQGLHDAERPAYRVDIPAELWAIEDAPEALFAPYLTEAQEWADHLGTIVDVVVVGGALRDAYATVAPQGREVEEYDRSMSQWKKGY